MREIHERDDLYRLCNVELAVRGKLIERKRRWKNKREKTIDGVYFREIRTSCGAHKAEGNSTDYVYGE